MSAPVQPGERETEPRGPSADFAQRVVPALQAADGDRRRARLLRHTGTWLPFVLLVGPLIAWRLMLASPDGVHVSISALAWVAFVLDVGVHVDSAVLTYTHMQAIPSVVGAALGVVLALRLLWYTGQDI